MPDPYLKQALDALNKAIETEKRSRQIIDSLGPAVTKTLEPTLAEMNHNITGLSTVIVNAIRAIKVRAPEVNIPEVKVPKPEVTVNYTPPNINVPTPQVTVDYTPPEVKIPTIKVPTPKVTVKNDLKGIETRIKGISDAISKQEIVFPEYDLKKDFNPKNPMPVTLYDPDGKPHLWIEGGRGGSNDIKRSATGFYGAVDVATTATQIVGDNRSRKGIVFTHEANDTVYIGLDENVTTSTGFPVLSNQGNPFEYYTGAVYAIISTGAASSTISVRYQEVI